MYIIRDWRYLTCIPFSGFDVNFTMPFLRHLYSSIRHESYMINAFRNYMWELLWLSTKELQLLDWGDFLFETKFNVITLRTKHGVVFYSNIIYLGLSIPARPNVNFNIHAAGQFRNRLTCNKTGCLFCSKTVCLTVF